jgi:hypothetical protein
MGDPQPFVAKLDVNIDNIQKLTDNLKEDSEGFRGEMSEWGKTDRAGHPMHAQIGKSGVFKRGAYVFNQNFRASLDAMAMAMDIGNGLLFLQMGAHNVAALVSGTDSLANVKLGQVEDMFPDKPFKTGAGEGTAPLKDWVQIGNTGWDTNHDGVVDVYMPGSLDKSANPTDAQRKAGVKDVDGTTHDGYEVFDTDATVDDEGNHTWVNSDSDLTLSGAGNENLEGNEQDWREEQAETEIMAPGPLGGTSSSGGGQTNMV